MTFKYFLFETYPGMFILVLPLAIIISVIYGIIRFKNDTTTPKAKKLVKCFFICYLTGLFELVIFLDFIRKGWHWIIYHMDDGNPLIFFQLDLRPVLNFWTRMSGEVVGNVLAFIPFGLLHSACSTRFSFFKSLSAGALCSLIIEVTQIIVSRCTDVNDLLLNTFGTFIGIILFVIYIEAEKKRLSQ